MASPKHFGVDDVPLSDVQQYGLYCFQSAPHLERVVAWVCSGGHSNVLALAGPRGSGRGYFLYAVAHRARCRGTPVRVLPIDLEGYEPHDDQRIQKFLELQLKQRRDYDAAKREQVLKLALDIVKVGGAALAVAGHAPLAAIVSLVLSVTDPVKTLRTWLEKARDDPSAAPLSPDALLAQLIEHCGDNGRLIVHAPEPMVVDITLRNWLLDAAERHPRLILALSCTADDRDTSFVRQWTHPEWVELPPLTRDALRRQLQDKFDGPCPAELVEGLWQTSNGKSPKLLVNKLQALVSGGLLAEAEQLGHSCWCVTEAGAEPGAFAQQFAQDAYQPIRDALAALGSDAELMREFLLRAALCGRKAPCRLLMQSIGITGDAEEHLVDLIDDNFSEYARSGVVLFEDIPSGEPDFPGHPLYRFKSLLSAEAILAHRKPDELTHTAEQLIEFLKPRLPVTTRGIAHLYLDLADRSNNAPLRQAMHQELAWWIRMDDLDAFKASLQRDIDRGALTAEQLWQAAKIDVPGREHVQLCLLEVLEGIPAGIAVSDALAFHSKRVVLYRHLGRFAEALRAAELALETAQTTHGPNEPVVATCLNNLALLLQATNRLAEAEPLMRRALAIGEQCLGPDHPNVAIDLNNLALLLQATNRLAEAEPLMRRALTIDEQSFGPDHPNVARDLNNLAMLLQATNRLAEAEPLMRRALFIHEQSLGPDHPNVAIDLNNLALLLQATNRLAEAEPLMRRALFIHEQSLGPDHPNVAIDLNNLAQVLQATNRLAEAEPMMRRALVIDEQRFGPDHPNVARDLNNLAQLLKATNRLTEAEPLLRRALFIHEQSLGADHPDVAIDLNNLAQVLQATNRLAEAEPLFRRALEIDEQSIGPDHPNVAIRLSNLALLLHATNRLAEAEPLLRGALEVDTQSSGPDHPKVAIDLNNLALLLQATNRLAEAEPLFRRALEIDEQSIGPDHPDVATCLNNLAQLLRATNRLAEAEPMIRRALSISETGLGSAHPNTVTIRKNLEILLAELSQSA